MFNKNEIYVGLPFLKCSSNPSQTINAKTNKKSKTAVTKKIALEAFERFGNEEESRGAKEIAPQGKSLATMPDNLKSIHGTNRRAGEK